MFKRSQCPPWYTVYHRIANENRPDNEAACPACYELSQPGNYFNQYFLTQKITTFTSPTKWKGVIIIKNFCKLKNITHVILICVG